MPARPNNRSGLGISPFSAPAPSTGPPTEEIGAVVSTGIGVTPWTALSGAMFERVSELIWPRSVDTYNHMINDAQVEGLMRGSTMPIRRYKWAIDPNGSKPEITDGVARDLNLPVKGQEAEHQPRLRGRFNHDDHLYHALLALRYGHYPFEQVGRIADDGLWHLTKLAVRPPHSINQILIAQDGGLVAVRQSVTTMGFIAPEIPVDRLVWYAWDKEGANWPGRSMLRSCFKNWVLKDRELRIDAINLERGGGVPYIEAPPGATAQEIKALREFARQFKVGEKSGGAVPHGAVLKFANPNPGSAVESIRLQNEEMSRSFLMMFMQLGQTKTGSRALGSELIDFFGLSQEAIANWYAGITNEHVIEDWVDWNYGEGEELVPKLVWTKEDDPELAIADLALLVEQNIVQVDDELEELFRGRYQLGQKGTNPRQPVKVTKRIDDTTPPADVPTAPTPGVTAAEEEIMDAHMQRIARHAAAKTKRRRATVAASDPGGLPLPDRALRRQPYEQEVQAAVDFKAMDDQWESELEKVLSAWDDVTTKQVGELTDAVKAAEGDVTKLSSIEATPLGDDTLHTAMKTMADHGVAAARAEAKAQGKDVAAPNMADVYDSLAARAEAVSQLLARSIGQAAGNKAVAFTGGGMTDAEVAEAVGEYLTGLSGSYLRDQLSGALTQGLNTGRREVMRAAKPAKVYASELLDAATCENCVAEDGTEWDNIAEAEADYPTGGYFDCLGGPRCRGTLISVYDES